MVEHVKSFVESVCVTVLNEFRAPMPASSTPSTTELLVAALSSLGLRNSRGASQLDRVLSGFNKLAEALSDMRNANGPVAHGRDAFLDALTLDHSRAFVHTGDAILAVLLNALEGKQPDLTVTREPYESFPHLNRRIDRAVSLVARIDEDDGRPVVVFSIGSKLRGQEFELRVEPSQLLYGIDRDAYVDVLRTADLAIDSEDKVEETDETEEFDVESQGEPAISRDSEEFVSVALVLRYSGEMESLRIGVEGILDAQGVERGLVEADGTQLVDSLLATMASNIGTDWKLRGPLQARVRVACKRVLVGFRVPPADAAKIAVELMDLLLSNSTVDATAEHLIGIERLPE